MTITTEKSLRDFEFKFGAFLNVSKLSSQQLDEIERILEEAYPYGINETTLNDLFCFDFDSVCELLGIDETDL